MSATELDTLATAPGSGRADGPSGAGGPGTGQSGDGRFSLAAAVARLLGCTEGQAYTLAIGLVLAAVLAVAGVPAALQNKVASSTGSSGTSSGGSTAAAAPLPDTGPASPAASPAGGAALAGSSAGAGGPTNGLANGANAAAGRTQSPGAASAAGSSSPFAASSPFSGTSSPRGSSGAGDAPLPAVGTIATFARIGAPGAPAGIALAPDGSVFVTTDNGAGHGGAGASHVFGFDRTGAPRADVAVAGQPAGHGRGVTAAAMTADGKVVVVDAATARILRVDPAKGTQAVLAPVPDVPPCLVFVAARPCEPGVQDHAPSLGAVVVDRTGAVYVTDATQATIWRLRPGQATPDAWYQSDDWATGDGPAGLALDQSGALAVTVGTTLDVASPDAGALYRIPVGADGAPGARTLAATFARDSEPGPLTLGTSGAAYVVLRGPGAVVALDGKGAETARYAPPGGADVALDGPAGIAMGDGHLFVTNRGTGNDPARWAVLTIAVRDAPVRVS